jgi:hypothetical protein
MFCFNKLNISYAMYFLISYIRYYIRCLGLCFLCNNKFFRKWIMSSESLFCLVIDTTLKLGTRKVSCFGNDFGRLEQTQYCLHNIGSRIVLGSTIGVLD